MRDLPASDKKVIIAENVSCVFGGDGHTATILEALKPALAGSGGKN